MYQAGGTPPTKLSPKPMFKKIGASLLLIPTLLGGAALLSLTEPANAWTCSGGFCSGYHGGQRYVTPDLNRFR